MPVAYGSIGGYGSTTALLRGRGLDSARGLRHRTAVVQDRAMWLRERRAAVEAEYDLEAAEYDENPYPSDQHAGFIDRLLATCPPGGVVLDAPCGTGQYFARVAASGRRIVGIDQSAGMLAQARARGIAERTEHVGLQELRFEAEFDAAMTIDAIENVPPEEWPLVVRNVRRALKPGAHYYLTVEEVEEATTDEAFATLQERGVPAVRGEVIEGDTAGYHYYPGRGQALAWLEEAGFELVAEDLEWHDDWGYRHLLLQSSAG
jgi:SAM-dependent methyltransferase